MSGIAIIQTNSLTQKSIELTEQANQISNQSLALVEQANNLTATALQISNFNTTIVPYIVESDLGRINYTGSNRIDTEGFINLSLVVITPHAVTLNFSNGYLLNVTFPLRNDTEQASNGTNIPILDQSNFYDNMMTRFSENISWALTYNPPVGQTYISFVQPGVSQLNYSFPIHARFLLNQEYLNMLGKDWVRQLHLCDFKVTMMFTDLQTGQALPKEYAGTVDVYVTNGYPY